MAGPIGTGYRKSKSALIPGTAGRTTLRPGVFGQLRFQDIEAFPLDSIQPVPEPIGHRDERPGLGGIALLPIAQGQIQQRGHVPPPPPQGLGHVAPGFGQTIHGH